MSKKCGEVGRGEREGAGGGRNPYISHQLAVWFSLHAFLETPSVQAMLGVTLVHFTSFVKQYLHYALLL